MNEGRLLEREQLVVAMAKHGLSMREIADMLFRQKGLIGIWIALICGFVAGYLPLTPSRYRSQITFLLVSQRPLPVVSASEPQAGLAEQVTESQMATEMQLLSSKEILKQVVATCGLIPKNGKGSPGELMDKAVKRLSESLKITSDGKSDFITASYRGYSPAQATWVLRVLSERYLDHHLAIHRAAGNYDFFKEQAGHFEKEWREAQARMSAYELQTKVVVLDEQKDLGIRKLNDLEASVRETQSGLSEAEHREGVLLQQLSAAAPRITTQERTSPNQYSAERLNTMIVELENKRTELLTKFRPDNRLVQEVDQEIAHTQSALKLVSASESKEQASDVNPLRQTLEVQLLQARTTLAGLHARQETLARQIAQSSHRVDELGSDTGAYDSLAHDVKEAETKYLLYSRQSEEARISDEMDRKRMANVIVAEGPESPVTPEPKLSVDVFFGLLMVLFLILPVAFVRGLRRTQVFTPWELEGVAGVPVLGTVIDAV